MQSIERRIQLGDGAMTTVEQWGDQGPVILCVHGIGSSRKSWLRTAARFAGSYRVVAYDQRGHGDSATVSGPMTHEQSLHDLLAVARAIDQPIEALLGHSWGGAIALIGGRWLTCETVIAIDPMIRQAPNVWRSDFVEDLIPLLSRSSAEREDAVRSAFAGLPAVEADAKVHALREMAIDAVVALGEENRADAGEWDLREVVRDYPKPLLLILADQTDSVVSPQDRAFVRERGGPSVRIIIFEGEGHTLQRTAFERYATSVEEFCRSAKA